MAVTQYKCPNCGGAIVFDPAKQDLVCEYCNAHFTKNDFDKATAENESYESETVSYVCNNCGAEIITTPTTAATYCCYCHTPVVLAKRLEGAQKPDYVLPFKLTKEQALERFQSFFNSKKMLPPIFKERIVLDKIAGVYYPYWYADSDVGAELSATAKKIRTWTAGNYEYTETKTYDIQRSGTLDIDAVSEPAIKDVDRVNLNYLCPFDDKLFEDFSMTYFSGFMAEKKALEKEDVTQNINTKVKNLAHASLVGTVKQYSTIQDNSFNFDVRSRKWRYALLPVWVLTYSVEGAEYIYAINAQTGKIFGNLPTDMKRIRRLTVLLLIIGTIIGIAFGGVALL